MAGAVSERLERRGWRQWPDDAVCVLQMLRRAAVAALEHDALTVAQATAYSAMVALFPALIVAAAVVSWIPDTAPLRVQMAQFFNQVLPPNVSPLLEMYFSPAHRTCAYGAGAAGVGGGEHYGGVECDVDADGGISAGV